MKKIQTKGQKMKKNKVILTLTILLAIPILLLLAYSIGANTQKSIPKIFSFQSADEKLYLNTTGDIYELKNNKLVKVKDTKKNIFSYFIFSENILYNTENGVFTGKLNDKKDEIILSLESKNNENYTESASNFYKYEENIYFIKTISQEIIDINSTLQQETKVEIYKYSTKNKQLEKIFSKQVLADNKNGCSAEILSIKNENLYFKISCFDTDKTYELDLKENKITNILTFNNKKINHFFFTNEEIIAYDMGVDKATIYKFNYKDEIIKEEEIELTDVYFSYIDNEGNLYVKNTDCETYLIGLDKEKMLVTNEPGQYLYKFKDDLFVVNPQLGNGNYFSLKKISKNKDATVIFDNYNKYINFWGVK